MSPLAGALAARSTHRRPPTRHQLSGHPVGWAEVVASAFRIGSATVADQASRRSRKHQQRFHSVIFAQGKDRLQPPAKTFAPVGVIAVFGLGYRSLRRRPSDHPHSSRHPRNSHRGPGRAGHLPPSQVGRRPAGPSDSARAPAGRAAAPAASAERRPASARPARTTIRWTTSASAHTRPIAPSASPGRPVHAPTTDVPTMLTTAGTAASTPSPTSYHGGRPTNSAGPHRAARRCPIRWVSTSRGERRHRHMRPSPLPVLMRAPALALFLHYAKCAGVREEPGTPSVRPTRSEGPRRLTPRGPPSRPLPSRADAVPDRPPRGRAALLPPR